VYCTHKDRLCCSVFYFIEFIFHKNGTKIEVADNDNMKTKESQLAEDIMSILTGFGARVYGAQSGKRKKLQRSSDQWKMKQMKEMEGKGICMKKGPRPMELKTKLDGKLRSYTLCVSFPHT
jgi:hypothetical protein